MKFDCVLANPPYQSKAEKEFKKTTAIWHQFVEKSLSVLNDGGHMGMIHPSGWRNVDGMFKDTQKLILGNTVEYLEMHNKMDGVSLFGAATTYDIYCLKKEPNVLKKSTTIKLDDGSIVQKYINKMEFIPNGMFAEFDKLVAKPGEEKVEVLYSRSAYGTDKLNMSKEQTDEFKYPCIYYTYADGSLRFVWSSTNTNGHFYIPKVIFSAGTSTPIIDSCGEYALAQFAYAIIDNIENLANIKKAMETDEFIKLMKYADGTSGQRYNRKVISTFRKDFWKEFI